MNSPEQIMNEWNRGKYEQALTELYKLLTQLYAITGKSIWKEAAENCQTRHREWQAERLRSASEGRPPSRELKEEIELWLRETLPKTEKAFRRANHESDSASSFQIPAVISSILEKIGRLPDLLGRSSRGRPRETSLPPRSSPDSSSTARDIPPQPQPPTSSMPDFSPAHEEAMPAPLDEDMDMPAGEELNDGEAPHDVSFSPEAYEYDTCDWVNVSVYAPERVIAGEDFILSAFAHLFEQQEAVRTMAEEADPENVRQGGTRLNTPIEPGSPLEFHVQIRDWGVEPARQKILWIGVPTSADFLISVPEDASGKKIGKVIVVGDKGPVGSLLFNLTVMKPGEGQPSEEDQPAAPVKARAFRNTYLAYAQEDEARVKQLEPAFHTIGWNWSPSGVSGNDIDLTWKKEQLPLIRGSELFVLFWSRHAEQASRVEKEWLSALGASIQDEDGFPDFLAVRLDPQAPDPPETLRFLTFMDSFQPKIQTIADPDPSSMSPAELKDLCFDYVRNGDARVFDLLMDAAKGDQEMENAVTMQSSRWHQLEDQILMVNITDNDAKVARAQINRSILSLIGRLFT